MKAERLYETKMFFFRHWVVQDISAILKFSLNQKDAKSLSLFYYKINRYLSKAMLECAINLTPKESLIDTMTKYPGLKEFRQKKLRDLKIEFTTISKMAAESAVRFIENGCNYTDYIKEYCKKSRSSSDYASGIFEILIDIAHGCDTVPDFLKRLETLEQIYASGRTSAETNLTLSTQSIFLDEVAECMGIRVKKPDESENHLRKEITAAEGLVIHHKQFGEGIITSVDYQGKYILVDIKFKDQKRVLDWNVCLSNNLIYA